MNSNGLECVLLRELDQHLLPLGFRRITSKSYGDTYQREASGVRHTLGIGRRPYDEGLEVSVGSASVRYDAVEDLVAKFEDPHPLIGAEDIAARSTLTVRTSSSAPKRGDPLYGWGGTDRKVWVIHAAAEVPRVASEMAAYALENCEPIFSELSNADHALALLSGDDKYSRAYSGPDETRAKQTIALAFLLHGETDARELLKTKLARLRGEARSEVQRWADKFFEALSSNLTAGRERGI